MSTCSSVAVPTSTACGGAHACPCTAQTLLERLRACAAARAQYDTYIVPDAAKPRLRCLYADIRAVAEALPFHVVLQTLTRVRHDDLLWYMGAVLEAPRADKATWLPLLLRELSTRALLCANEVTGATALHPVWWFVVCLATRDGADSAWFSPATRTIPHADEVLAAWLDSPAGAADHATTQYVVRKLRRVLAGQASDSDIDE